MTCSANVCDKELILDCFYFFSAKDGPFKYLKKDPEYSNLVERVTNEGFQLCQVKACFSSFHFIFYLFAKSDKTRKMFFKLPCAFLEGLAKLFSNRLY